VIGAKRSASAATTAAALSTTTTHNHNNNISTTGAAAVTSFDVDSSRLFDTSNTLLNPNTTRDRSITYRGTYPVLGEFARHKWATIDSNLLLFFHQTQLKHHQPNVELLPSPVKAICGQQE